ncbi:hypothetical protein SAMN05421820_103128 [Pedobacter steynii]|uniref:Uncharacterized protein n=2 Tax=Pedobacter steynii TaxID=430522 RepID=A0A1G9R6B9_9SPHI|nr:hypothetical protein SAMN05421820_103128 [Pedobacter steynii]
MCIGSASYAQTIELCSRGLSLFPLGSKLNDTNKLDLQDIDTSNLEGMLEYSLASAGTDKEDSYTFKKLIAGRYIVREMESTSCDIYIGFTKEYEIRQIVIKLRDFDFSHIKDIINRIYGTPEVEGTSEINGAFSHQTCVWSGADFDVIFSGLGGDIGFYYRRSAEDMERKLNRLIKGLH